jgi:hypothetical protein
VESPSDAAIDGIDDPLCERGGDGGVRSIPAPAEHLRSGLVGIGLDGGDDTAGRGYHVESKVLVTTGSCSGVVRLSGVQGS